MDHPSSLQESGPKLSKFFKPAQKQVDFSTIGVKTQCSRYFPYLPFCLTNFV